MHSWPPWWSWTLPQGFPALATSSRWFWPFKVCHFDLPGLRYEPETAEKFKKIHSRPAVFPTVQSKKVANIKVAPPTEIFVPLAWWWPKKVLHFDPSSQSYEASKKGVPLFGAISPKKRTFLMHSWPPWWSWTLPQGFPALATSSRWFWPFKVCHFDLPGLRYEPETAEKYKKIDGRPAVLPAVQSKKVEITKVAPPLESSFRWLDDGQKQFCISALLARVMKRQR